MLVLKRLLSLPWPVGCKGSPGATTLWPLKGSLGAIKCVCHCLESYNISSTRCQIQAESLQMNLIESLGHKFPNSALMTFPQPTRDVVWVLQNQCMTNIFTVVAVQPQGCHQSLSPWENLTLSVLTGNTLQNQPFLIKIIIDMRENATTGDC